MEEFSEKVWIYRELSRKPDDIYNLYVNYYNRLAVEYI